jgi:mannose-6-phosphate isomerase
MSVYPYKFDPIYKEKIWGGRALERLFGRRLPGGAKVGESWELADLPEGVSVVVNGPDAGKTLAQLLAERGGEILGRAVPVAGGRFPLLLKLLDANDILSLQVHPDERAVERLGPPAALKTECWYVLESRDGHILKGVADGVGEEDFRRALSPGDDAEALRRLVRRFDVKAGDFHFLPAGTVHALGAGVVVAEIQTPSDTTYRVSDWGRGREIHVTEALACIHFAPPAEAAGAGGDVLVRTPHFTVRKLSRPVGQAPLAGGACSAWMVLSGRGRVECPAAAAELRAGDTVLIPAAIDRGRLIVEKEMTCLEVTLPE